MVLTDDFLATLPPELLSRVVQQASLDAELTIHALNVVGLAPPPNGTRVLPGEFLLELGAAMRIMVWELQGLDLQAFDLPSAHDAIHHAFADAVQRLRDPTHRPTPSLSSIVLKISTEHLAWTGPTDLHAEIQLDMPDENALVEAMAQFLWNNRDSYSAIEGSFTS